ncbi:DUF421 domain-containing protein [Mesonia ostreae]|uniref:DUF421 domain-containing protein n=1 Tax=Mesonia ostreae TaxID=861110 RepID=A0ABU2KE92_9FLAO|nr:YetF domain-containing protein [Mesonia ostreae]MDT0293022.1 DUF421 domain-containing protein [Mesonia ostreae]
MENLSQITEGIEKWFVSSPQAILAITLSTLAIYIAVIAYTRMFGKRSLSKMSSFDFAMTVAVGSLIATTSLSPSVSLMDGLVGLFMIYLFQLSVAFGRRWKLFRNAVDNSPLLLMSGSKILKDNLRKARLSEGDLRSKLREANVLDLEDIRAVVFETTGNIVVMHSTDKDKELKNWLLKDVKLS